MPLYDLHTHSEFSHDIRDPENSVFGRAKYAKEKGLSGIAFTDHFDFLPSCFCHYNENPKNVGVIDKELILGRRNEIFRVKEHFEDADFSVFYGLELGGQYFATEKIAKSVICEYDFDGLLDIVLGSVHTTHGGFAFSKKALVDQCSDDELIRQIEIYLDDLLWLSKYGEGDVLSHCNVYERYIVRFGRLKDYNPEKYDEIYECIFKNIIERGVALEVNTAGPGKEPVRYMCPDARLLRLYKSLGGELVTVGSDAHTMNGIGGRVFGCLRLLSALGFKYQCIFEKRKTKVISL